MRKLDITYKHKCFGLSGEEFDELIKVINTKKVPFITIETGIWFLNQDLSTAKGKSLKDYTQNWRRNTRYLRGREMKANTTDAITAIKTSFKEQVNVKVNQAHCILLDAERAYHYLFYDAVKQRQYIDTVNEIVLKGDELRVELCHIAKQLAIEEKSAIKTLTRHTERFERLGPIIRLKNMQEYTYFLNESQAFLLGAISRNTEEVLDFKVWLVDTFSRARKRTITKVEDHVLEKDIHKQIIELASYTSLKFRSEVPLDDRRIDLLVSESIAIELKKDRISVGIITELIGKKGYLAKLKSHYNNFKILLICSPAGITEEANYMLEAMYPYVQFVVPRKIGDSLADLALKEYPSCSHWWLYNFVFNKFSNILSSRFLDRQKVSNKQKTLLPTK